MNDVLLGAADRYTLKDVKPWAASARQAGFTGRIYLVTYRVENGLTEALAPYDVECYPCAHTPQMTEIAHGVDTKAHNLRFYHFWELLSRLAENNNDADYVIMTDVRDVIFQRNPSVWLRENEIARSQFIAPSEGLLYKQEEWGQNNMIMGFGPVIWDMWMKDRPIYNVGTIAGGFAIMQSLALLIFSMTEGRYYPSDQSSFNLLASHMLRDKCAHLAMYEGWAAQIGTTLDPTKQWLWDRLLEPAPKIRTDGVVVNVAGEPFCIVHQWDRNPILKAGVIGKYNL